MAEIDWIRGDLLDIEFPAHGAALQDGGAAFLTRAFRAAGALGTDNAVAGIDAMQTCHAGSTGSKFLLDVRYQHTDPDLHTALFVKFSRDFSDPIRDQAKVQLAPEVQLALLSRNAAFPIAAPQCYFADYHRGSGTGVLITERIAFGRAGIEPMYDKCRDHIMPEPLAHYRAIITALARLGAAHRSGQLANQIDQVFPFNPAIQSLGLPIRYNREQLERRIDKLEAFATTFPRLLPGHLRQSEFFKRLREEMPLCLAREKAIKSYLHGDPDMIALLHWNANVDNAWFWREGDGQLRCGLLDWGGVSQMNMGLALWGALSAAETEMWDASLPTLLNLFTTELAASGGPAIAPDKLDNHLLLATVMMSLSWLMDAPAMVRRDIPQLAPDATRFDQAFTDRESPRVQLQMLNNFLNLWHSRDLPAIIDVVTR